MNGDKRDIKAEKPALAGTSKKKWK